MKKNIFFGSILILLFSFSSCIKQEEKIFQGDPVIEFDAAVLNSATNPYTYHVATRTPPFGIQTTTGNSTPITRTMANPQVKLRVNLVGPQRNNDEVLSYRVVTDVTPNAPNMVAVEGTHFTTGNTFTIPANSSFGEITINVLNTGTSSTSPREVHLELLGNEQIKPSQNYARVGIRIAQN